MTGKKITKEEALRYLKEHHPDLSRMLKDADRDTVVNLRSVLEKTLHTGHDPSYLAFSIGSGLKSGAIPLESLPQTAESLRAIFEGISGLERVPKDRFRRGNMADILSSGFNYGAIDHESVRLMMPAITALLANRRDPRELVSTVSDNTIHKKLDPESLRLMAPALGAAAKIGRDPVQLLDTLATGLKSKAITHDSLRLIGPLLEATAKGGHDPYRLIGVLLSGLRSEAITHESLPHYTELFKAAPREWKPHEVLEHSLEAHKMGVPPGKIPLYQKKLMERGHYPNAGLVHELHTVAMRKKK